MPLHSQWMAGVRNTLTSGYQWIWQVPCIGFFAGSSRDAEVASERRLSSHAKTTRTTRLRFHPDTLYAVRYHWSPEQ
jgi:hypothetical protein